jgi:hypothetical protein
LPSCKCSRAKARSTVRTGWMPPLSTSSNFHGPSSSSARADGDKLACLSIGQNILEWNCFKSLFQAVTDLAPWV